MKDITKHLQQELYDNAGGTVVIPDGEFMLTKRIIVPANTMIKGTVVNNNCATQISSEHDDDLFFFRYPCKNSGTYNITFNTSCKFAGYESPFILRKGSEIVNGEQNLVLSLEARQKAKIINCWFLKS